MKKLLTGEKNRTKKNTTEKMTTPMPETMKDMVMLDADGEKTEKVDEPLHGAGTDRNGWSNDRIRSRRSVVRYQ